jgi:aldose 1-epimerase
MRISILRTQTVVAMAAACLLTAGCKQAAPPEQPAKPAIVAEPLEMGGQKIVKLERKPTSNGTKPEFLSATILPGRGMNLFQITASIPGKGIVDVFTAPSLADAATVLNGNADDRNGNKSFSLGGAFLVPYPNRIRGKLSDDKKTITATWHGKTLNLPANWAGKLPGAEPHAMHGLILGRQTDDVQISADGSTITGVIHAGSFGGYWPSETDLKIVIALNGDTVDTSITAKNVGKEPEPMAIGWHPYFNLPSGDRTQARLHVPADVTAQVNNYDDVFPTGKLVPVKGTPYDFNAPDGKALGDMFLDDNFAHLKRTKGQVVVDVIDPAAHYGVHIIGLSPEIKTVQVYAPKTKAFMAVEEQYNFGDPFSGVWKGMDTGMVTLKPGQSTTWKTRMQLFTPAP